MPLPGAGPLRALAFLAALALSAAAQAEAPPALDPADLSEPDLRALLRYTQSRIDALDAAQAQLDNGETVLRIGDSLVTLREEQASRAAEQIATLIDFAQSNSEAVRGALAERIREVVEAVGNEIADDMLDAMPAMGDDGPEARGLMGLVVSELARATANAAVQSDGVITAERIRGLIAQRIDALRLTSDQIGRDLAEWQDAYDAFDDLLDGLTGAPAVSPDNCHGDIETAHDRILEQDFDLYIADFNGTGRYLIGQDGVYCEASGSHFYREGGAEWERWALEGGQWVLNSYLVITERDGRDSRNRRVMTGYSRRPGEERLRSRYTITYPD